MTFEDFKEIHKKKGPIEKLHTLIRIAETMMADQGHICDAMARGNVKEATYWGKDKHQMEERIEWLAEEIENRLRLDGHVPEIEKPPKPKPRRGCENCPNFKMEENAAGGSKVHREKQKRQDN